MLCQRLWLIILQAPLAPDDCSKFLYTDFLHVNHMAPVRTRGEIEKASRNAVEALYGSDLKDFKIRVLFAFPNEQKRDSWDVQVTFLKNKLQYTVDLMIQEQDGQITNARLIDTMTPL